MSIKKLKGGNIMIKDLEGVMQTTDSAVLDISHFESQLSIIYSLFFRKTREEKEKAINDYLTTLHARKEVDSDIDVIIDYHTSIVNAMRAMQYSKRDSSLHKQRVKSMKEMLKHDNFTFSKKEILPQERVENMSEIDIEPNYEKNTGIIKKKRKMFHWAK